MRYVKARIQEEQRELAYRIYITDSLKNYLGLNVRYADFLIPPKEEETRTSEEVITNIKTKLKKLGGE